MISPDLNKIEKKHKLGRTMSGCNLLLYDMARKIRTLETILEIGVRQGTSTNCFLLGIADRPKKRFSKAHLYSIDIKDTSAELSKFFGEERFNEIKEDWTFIVSDSKKAKWDKEIDILLIDGDHSYEGVKTDYDKYVPFVKKGGLILIHDVCNHGEVKKFWDELGDGVVLPLSFRGMGIIEKK